MMNFFKRRKILKNTSFLDLRPVRISEYEDEGMVTLLIPKFRSERWRRFLIPGTKSEHFKIKFDELGSEVWRLIDGEMNVKDLCESLIQKLGDKLQPYDEANTRVMKFLSQMYDQGYITFRELQDN